jgi:hypothetical protein
MQWFATHKKQHQMVKGDTNAKNKKKRAKSVNAIK